MLGEGRGILVPPRDVPALASVLGNLSRSPNDYLEMRRKAAAWARQFSIEGLRDALLQLLNERWGVALQPSTGRRLVA
jgi:glycosyltransferase involved in cell wall biosynthesis